MKDLTTFDYTPEYQPFEGEEISFRLKPLDQPGCADIESAIADGDIRWVGVEVAARYIVGWKGSSLGEYSRARVKQVVYGAPDRNWRALLKLVALTLYKRSQPEDDAAKKS